MKKETIMRFISVPTAKGLCGARRVAMMLLMTMLTSLGAWAAIQTNFPTPSGGEGTSENPYKISSTSDLDMLAEDVNKGVTYEDKYFELTQNITYDTSGLGETESNFTPIGGSGKLFKGHFDGKGKTIKGIRVYRGGNSEADTYLGLFGAIESSEELKPVEVKNLTLKDTKITGSSNCGGIAGGSFGYATITNCHVAADVIIHTVNGSTSSNHGGIVGVNSMRATVSGCTSAATISIADGITNFSQYGGIAGENDNLSTIKDCLALKAKVTGSSYVGAIVGMNTGILSNNCYTRYGVCGVGELNSARGSDQAGAQYGRIITGDETPTEFGSVATTYGESDYTGITSYSTKGLKYGKYTNSEYFFYSPVTLNEDYWGFAGGANGTVGHPYKITSTEGLDMLSEQVKGGDGYEGEYFELGANITYTYSGTNPDNYTAIGYYSNGTYCQSFMGHFDGKGHTVSGIRIYKSTGINQGLFGYVTKASAEVKNVTLDDAIIISSGNSAGIVGKFQYATVSNCHVTASVTIDKTNSQSPSNRGGIIGECTGGTVSGCTSAATVIGNNYIGGIIGYNGTSTSTIKDCLYLGTSLTGSNYVGAIAGTISGTSTNNYYTKSGLGGVNGADTDGAKLAVGLSSVPSSYDIGAEGTTYGESTYTGITAYANGLKYNSKYYLPITPVVLSLADNDDNSTALSTNNGDLANVTLDGRTLYCDGDWNTLTLPFSLTAEEIAASPLAGLTIKKLLDTSNLDGDGKLTLNFEDATTIEAGKPYIVKKKADLVIKNKDDWDAFAADVNGGNTYEGKVVMLASNFDNSGEGEAVTTLVGKISGDTNYPFKGTFDGNGRTLTVNINSTSTYTAPFHRIIGATIKNLRVAGSITSENRYMAGLVGRVIDGTVNIQNCEVSATLTTKYNTENSTLNGGIVGVVMGGTVTVSNCLFSGKMLKDASINVEHQHNAGIVGYAYQGSTTVSNSLFAPTEITMSTTNSQAIAVKDTGSKLTITNCYYNSVGSAFGHSNGGTAASTDVNTLVNNLGSSNWEISGDNVVPVMNNNIVNPVFESVIIDNTENPVNFTGGSFVGNYAPLAINDANRKSIVLLAAGNKLGYAKTNRTLGAFRAYFDIPSVAGAPAISSYELNFGEDDENTTGIIEVNTNNTNLTNKAEGVFDLQGRRVENPAKGLYIVNGKKIVIK